jgi:tetratricopeptide (TPR) repeat protein
MQRKWSKWSLIVLAVFIPAMIIFGIVMDNREKARENIKALEKHDWCAVDRNVRLCNIDEAIRIGEEYIQITPQYPLGHYWLAGAYLAAGRIKDAKAHYAEAYRLLPCEEYEKLVIAADKRIKKERPQPVAPAKAASPHR